MEDDRIVELYWARSENAISETAERYGKYCRYIAYNILYNDEDSEECVNDTYLAAWNSMPDKRPDKLSAFLGKLTRNLALKRRERNNAGKRGSGQVALALDELKECVPAADNMDRLVDDIALAEVFNRFLASLSKEKRIFFMRRYWYFCPVAKIAGDFSVSESKVKMSLLRTRNELKLFLEKEGIDL